ncbi:MAG: acetyl-CoA carboxylase carboxyltransferase subunit alpha [Christensenellales bacterium]|jgi:acetyl-CoA carboxylase carboxyl transferase subunit alpha
MDITAHERVMLARDSRRPNIRDYIGALLTDFFEIRGDRRFADDRAIVCGIGRFCSIPVTVAGHCKGHTLQENIDCNFGMPEPEGYRKWQRAMAQAEKFGRPIITFVDTPGAYPGKEAEERGQGEAIAQCLFMMSNLKVPILCVVTGEGGSGGALALSVADRMLMLSNAVYSVLSPEGFASILWKDASRTLEASAIMKLTAQDLFSFGIADRIIEEPSGGAGAKPHLVIARVKKALREELFALLKSPAEQYLENRYAKYRAIGL